LQSLEARLAQLYQAGEGVPRNLDMAASWYADAAAHGLSAAARKVASLREERRQAAVSPDSTTGPPDKVASLREERQGALSSDAAKPTLIPAVPTGPSVTPVSSGTGETVQVELSWAAPAEPAPVDFSCRFLRWTRPALIALSPVFQSGRRCSYRCRGLPLTTLGASIRSRRPSPTTFQAPGAIFPHADPESLGRTFDLWRSGGATWGGPAAAGSSAPCGLPNFSRPVYDAVISKRRHE
jgi:hypothetical protein